MRAADIIVSIICSAQVLQSISGFVIKSKIGANVGITTTSISPHTSYSLDLTKSNPGNNKKSALSARRDDAEVESLRAKAELLRQEVQSFEKGKDNVAKQEQQARDKVAQEKQETRMRYSAEVPILKGDGSEVMERCDFPPRIKTEGKESNIIAIQANLPLGLILGQSEEMPGITTVDEVGEGSNAELAGVKVGDILRACTACQVSMEMPTWQLMAGGIGRPKTSRMMWSVDGKVFEEVMEALISNSMDPQARPVWLVVERIEDV
uniref:PDZ domain-containing protein n=1 Tax=Chaetoceros debilis TaxID=122233 RepID=A0A7S3PTY6_9STRA|mmetsp:Transcript_21196/g.32210  ORF Transcript_21196/g.32210 Transcript_21196/m.32210 type:complete len:265 (-) Transcript_21196:33-827(-)